MKRPLSVSIIGWLLIVLAAINLLTVAWSFHRVGDNPRVAALMASGPVSLAVQEAVGLIGCLADIAAGVLLLRRIEAGRTIYVAWTVLILLFSLWSNPITLAVIPAVIVFVVISAFLFRRPVTAWLRADAHP